MATVTTGKSILNPPQTPSYIPAYNWNLANVQSTAVTPGTAQGANSNVSSILKGATNLKEGYDWLNSLNTPGTTSGVANLGLGNVNSGISPTGNFANNTLDLSKSTYASDIGAPSTSTGSSWSDSLGFGQYKDILGGQAFGSTGFLGDLGGNAFNSLGNGLLNTGAGFLGNLAGSALFGDSAGSQIGSTIGGIAGSFLGPLGSFGGSFLGSAIGSLFGGGSKPHPVSESAFSSIKPDGSFGSVQYGAKHISEEAAKQGASSFQQYLQSQAKKYGIEYKGDINGRVDFTPDQGKLILSKGTDPNSAYSASLSGTSNDNATLFAFNPNDTTSREKAYKQAFDYLAQASGYDPAALVEKTTTAPKITITPDNTPSDWDTFLANYRQQHSSPTPQV